MINKQKKIFKSLDEQIEILIDRGLIINDVDKAKGILVRENYFFLSGYREIFTKENKHDHFMEGTKFEELYAMLICDRKIRNIFFKNILIIENNMKSIISYQLSKRYGFKEKDYLNLKNFTQDRDKLAQVNDVLNKMKRQIRVNGNHHTATYHYIANYGYIPLWILVKVLSFGIISELYGILKNEDQMKVAQIYNIDPDTLIIYLSVLSNFRNICAHEEVLFNHRTQRPIPDNEIHEDLNIEIKDEEYIYGKIDSFAVLIIFKFMLSEEEFREVIREVQYEIDILSGKVNTVSINTILNTAGFPDNWAEIINI